MMAPLIMGGTGDQTLSAQGGTGTIYSNLTVGKVDGTLTIMDQFACYGNLSLAGGNVDPGTSTIVFTGNNTSNVTGGFPFFNLTVNKANQCGVFSTGVNLFKDVAIGGTLTLFSGTLAAPDDHNLSVAGNIVFSPTNGRFIPARSTLILNGTGAQSVDFGGQELFNLVVNNNSGAVTFVHGFDTQQWAAFNPGNAITFTAGESFAFQHFSAVGATGSPINFQSSVRGQPWQIAVQQYPATCKYVSVQDSVATGNPMYAIRGVDSGNNKNWMFLSTPMVAINNSSLNSITNPAWIEGTSWPSIQTLSVSAGGSSCSALRLGFMDWFADNASQNSLPLGVAFANTTDPVQVTLTASDGIENYSGTQAITWVTTDLNGQYSSSNTVVIRQNDTLLLTSSVPELF
jgi:hypothetical protein